MTTVGIADALSNAIDCMWPKRSAQELLLDLGEHKAWTAEEQHRAVGKLAGFLVDELGLPRMLAIVPRVALSHREIVDRAERVTAIGVETGESQSEGVGRGCRRLATLTGSGAKALSNSLSGGLQPARPDHRWIAVLARIDTGPLPLDAWLYHERSAGSVEGELSALAARAASNSCDAGDALLVHSLMALWQRRRPPAEAKGSLKRLVPRRRLAKPLAMRDQTLITFGQLESMLRLSAELGGARGRALAALAIECALTEAHLRPHSARRWNDAASLTGLTPDELWHQRLETGIRTAALRSLLGDDVTSLFQFRIALMRAWRDRKDPPPPPLSIADHPYVTATLTIHQARQGLPAQFDGDSPGAFMLRPQARSLGLWKGP